MCRTKCFLVKSMSSDTFQSPQWSKVHRAFSGKLSSTQHRTATQPVSEPPSHSLPFVYLARYSERSPRKSSGLKTNTVIFEFAQEGLSLPEAEGESWGQHVRTQAALAYFSCQPSDLWLQSCSKND